MSEFRIGDYNYVFDSTVGLTPSSVDPEFPVSNLRNYLTSKVMRTHPLGTFVIDTTNNKLDFNIGGGPVVATLTAGTYTATTLTAEIVTRMNAAAAGTYTCAFSTSTGKWTITKSAGTLSLLWATGANTASGVHSTIGFPSSSDYTGALAYTGSFIALHTEESVIIDLRTNESIDSFAMIFDKMVGSQFTAEAVLKLQANATNAWTTPAVDVTLSFDTDYDLYTHFFSSAQSYRYWRLKMVDPKNPNLFLEIPKLFLTYATQLTQVPQLGFAMVTRDRSEQQSTPYGHRYSDVYPNLRGIDFKYAIMGKDDLKTLEDIYERVGSVAPVFMALDPTATLFDKDRFFLYGYLKNTLGREHVFNEYFNTGLMLEEAL